MSLNQIKNIIEKNSSKKRTGLYSVCSANELVIRAAIRDAAAHKYTLIIECTSNQVNQFGGYTGIRPHEFIAEVQKIAVEENLPPENLIMGGDHLGPLIWQNENEESAMGKAAEMIKAYTLAGFTKIHLDTSMKLAGDPSGPLDPKTCARRGAVLAKTVYETFQTMPDKSKRPALVIGSEVPVPGGQKNKNGNDHENGISPTDADDFLMQVSVFKDEFQKAKLDFNDVVAFVVQPGVEFGDDFVFFYDSEKARPLCNALKTMSGFVFEGHSSDYQGAENLSNMVRDGIAILKVGPALTFALREVLFLLEAVEEILIPAKLRSGRNVRSNFKKTLLDVMYDSRQYWEKYYSGDEDEIRYKMLYSYSDRCRYYLPSEKVQASIKTLLNNIPKVPPALLSQYFPFQYSQYMAGKINNDPLTLIYSYIARICREYAEACSLIQE